MTRQQIFSVVFFSLLVLLLYQIGLMFKPFVFSALWASLLAHWAFPLHSRLTQLFAGKDALSASLLTVGTLGTILTSPDAVTWTRQSSLTDYNLNAVAYGNGLFVAAVQTGRLDIAASTAQPLPQSTSEAPSARSVASSGSAAVAPWTLPRRSRSSRRTKGRPRSTSD